MIRDKQGIAGRSRDEQGAAENGGGVRGRIFVLISAFLCSSMLLHANPSSSLLLPATPSYSLLIPAIPSFSLIKS